MIHKTPLLFHRIFFCEEGTLLYRFLIFAPLLTFIENLVADSYPFMIISPDGIRMLNEDEIQQKQASHSSVHSMTPMQKMQTRYLLQCLSKIEALEVDRLLYLCWTPGFSSLFKVKRNAALFNETFHFATSALWQWYY